MHYIFKLKQCVIILYAVVTGIDLAKILGCYPIPSISHHMVFRAITSELVKLGHNVTVVTTNPLYLNGSTPDNLTEIDIGETSYKILKYNYATAISGKKSDMMRLLEAGMDVNIKIFEQIIKEEKIRNLYQENFDLLLLEGFFTPLLSFTHIFKSPTILVSSFGFFPGYKEITGAPTHPLLYNDFFQQRDFNLTIWEKITEMINYFRVRSIIRKAEDKTNKMFKNYFGLDFPLADDLRNNIDMLFLNVDPIWERNHPVPPNIIFMGGIHQTLPKKLPQNLQHYLDTSLHGTIYFSLGTNVNTSSLTKHTITVLTKVFTELSYNVLCKWDSDTFPVKSKNIKAFRWFPQADLLRHKNVKAFVTQGGLQSTDEAITAGVPLIGIPMLGDQWHNVENYVFHGIGLKLDLENLTEEKLRKAIIEVAETERNNIKRLRSLIQDQSQTSLERTIWWIEYVIRHKGAKHLRAPTANMSWYDYLEFELFGVMLFATFTLILVTYVAIKTLIYFDFKIILFKNKLKTHKKDN